MTPHWTLVYPPYAPSPWQQLAAFGWISAGIATLAVTALAIAYTTGRTAR